MLRGIELDQLAEIHEAGKLGDSCRLLQIVGHDDDGDPASAHRWFPMAEQGSSSRSTSG